MSTGNDELDEIQGIFFEECAEGLAVAEQGLSAMADGDVSADVIAGVFRAVHSIKGGSGAFGHAALLHQPPHPHLDVRVHHDDQREQRRQTGFHQQRDVLDDDGIVGHRRDDLRSPPADQRVHDPVERLACVVVTKSLGS